MNGLMETDNFFPKLNRLNVNEPEMPGAAHLHSTSGYIKLQLTVALSRLQGVRGTPYQSFSHLSILTSSSSA